MLIGEYRHSIDKKGRTSLPSKFRKEIGRSVFVARGFDKMIDVYTKDAWKKLNEKLSELPMSVEANRKVKEFILGGAYEANPDKQGRVLVSQALLDWAGIKSGEKLVWAGVGDKAEIWSEKRWDERIKNTADNIGDIAESLGGII